MRAIREQEKTENKENEKSERSSLDKPVEKELVNELDNLIRSKQVCDMLILSSYLANSKGSVANMEKGFDRIKDYAADHLGKQGLKEVCRVLGMANVLMLRFERAKDYFVAAEDNEKLKELLELGLTYGRHGLVNDLIKQGQSLSRTDYSKFIVERAIPNMRVERETNTFYLDEQKLEQMLDNYEAAVGSNEKVIVDRKRVVKRIVDKLEKAGNENIPRRVFLADYSGDPWLISSAREDFKKKLKPVRRRIDDVVNEYCKESSIRLVKKIQSGDSDDFFPISSHLYLAEEESRGTGIRERIVIKENLKLYVDFSRLDGYNMEKEIYEKISKKPHDNIISYLGSAKKDGVELLKFKFFEGENLSKYTKKGARLSLKEGVRIIRVLADVMNYLHDNNILYGDIKDTNVLYSPRTKEVKLLDFGMSRLLEEKVSGDTYVTSLLSTPKYVAPETGTRFRVYKKTDVFQLGVLLYELVVGKHPFAKPGYELAEGEGDGLRESEIMKYSLCNLCKEYDSKAAVLKDNNELKELLDKALEKNIDKRISMKDFYAQIRVVEEKISGKINRGKNGVD
ncbi:protein kinase [Candidatus Woesearchaeota archaeon]|nr:protein kinase [Candidatus Woesearchaeota archaeon]